MKNIHKSIILSLVTLALLLIIGSFKISPPGNTSIAVIICNDNPIAFKDNPALSVSIVKSYFLRKGRKKWSEMNKDILPVDRKKNCPERELFYVKVLNKTAFEVESYFIEQQYQSGEDPPHKFSSDKEIIDFVGDEIGAIGYININSLTTEAKTKVKVVLIINN